MNVFYVCYVHRMWGWESGEKTAHQPFSSWNIWTSCFSEEFFCRSFGKRDLEATFFLTPIQIPFRQNVNCSFPYIKFFVSLISITASNHWSLTLWHSIYIYYSLYIHIYMYFYVYMYEWVSEWVKSLSRVWLFGFPWTVAHQASPSMGFSRQEYWSGLPFPSPGDLSSPGIEPRSPALQAEALTSEPDLPPISGIEER